jgi:two-component system chemotaxis response regulator CheY
MTKKTALIAEDITQTRVLLRGILKRSNCEVVKEITDGRKVIPAIQSLKPDLVFLDLDLPGEDGFKVLGDIKSANLHDCVWVISASTDEATKSRAMLLGAKGFIAKPFNEKTIQAAIVKSGGAIGKESDIVTAIIAEDEPVTRQAMREILGTVGCQTVGEFFNGKSALDHLTTARDLPQITFLDIEMPDGDGLTILKQIKQRQIDTFTVIVSAHSTVDNVKNALGMGADGFVVKPVTRDKLVQILEKYKKRLHDSDT